jgi:hypothetical protein
MRCRIHPVLEFPSRRLTPFREVGYRTILILAVFTPPLQRFPVLCCPPSQVISIVGP